jgi:hypothetical protein
MGQDQPANPAGAHARLIGSSEGQGGTQTVVELCRPVRHQIRCRPPVSSQTGLSVVGEEQV